MRILVFCILFLIPTLSKSSECMIFVGPTNPTLAFTRSDLAPKGKLLHITQFPPLQERPITNHIEASPNLSNVELWLLEGRGEIRPFPWERVPKTKLKSKVEVNVVQKNEVSAAENSTLAPAANSLVRVHFPEKETLSYFIEARTPEQRIAFARVDPSGRYLVVVYERLEGGEFDSSGTMKKGGRVRSQVALFHLEDGTLQYFLRGEFSGMVEQIEFGNIMTNYRGKFAEAVTQVIPVPGVAIAYIPYVEARPKGELTNLNNQLETLGIRFDQISLEGWGPRHQSSHRSDQIYGTGNFRVSGNASD